MMNVTINQCMQEVLTLSCQLDDRPYPYILTRKQLSALGNREYQFQCKLCQVVECCSNLIKFNSINNPQHPLVRLFVDVLIDCDVVHSVNRYGVCDDNLEAVNESLRLFVMQAHSSDIKKEISNINRRELRNRPSLYKYIDEMFEHTSRLLVIRVDLYYHYSARLTIGLVAKDRERYLKLVKDNCRHLVGYNWKLEYGDEQSFHYHMLFMFDGSLAHGDVMLGEQLGRLWEDVVRCRDRGGYYHNCNRGKDSYEECYLGMIAHNDRQKRDALVHAEYLIKNDERIIAVQLDGAYRVFGHSKVPTRCSRAGRPRRSSRLSLPQRS